MFVVVCQMIMKEVEKEEEEEEEEEEGEIAISTLKSLSVRLFSALPTDKFIHTSGFALLFDLLHAGSEQTSAHI